MAAHHHQDLVAIGGVAVRGERAARDEIHLEAGLVADQRLSPMTAQGFLAASAIMSL